MIRKYYNHGPCSAGYDEGPLENGVGQQSDKGTRCFHGPGRIILAGLLWDRFRRKCPEQGALS
jgi:hypothetical protein